jgi:hypothetical protein
MVVKQTRNNFYENQLAYWRARLEEVKQDMPVTRLGIDQKRYSVQLIRSEITRLEVGHGTV